MIDSSKWTGRTDNFTTLTMLGAGGAYDIGDIITVMGCGTKNGSFQITDIQTNTLTVKDCPWYLRLWWWILQLLYVPLKGGE